MKTALALVLLALTGCAGQPNIAPEYFSRQEQFAADRVRETTTIDSISYEEAFSHVTAVLMDLDCQPRETNLQLGLISGSASSQRAAPPGTITRGNFYRSCAGRAVTVSVVERPSGDIVIRASFYPPDAAADQSFETLLRKSISLTGAAGESP